MPIQLRAKSQQAHISEPERLTGQFFTMSTLQWAWSLTRSAVSPNSRPHSSEWSLCPSTMRSKLPSLAKLTMVLAVAAPHTTDPAIILLSQTKP